MLVRDLRARRGLVVLSVVLLASVLVPPALDAATGTATVAPAAVLDHFECSPASAATSSGLRVPFRSAPHTMLLKNRFALGGFTVALGQIRMQCSPAQQTMGATGNTVTNPITNPNARLVCWAISAAAVRLPTSLTVTNQFGTSVLQPTGARSLCLPSWKNTATPSTFPATSAPWNLDPYVCYSAIHPTGTPSFQLPPSVTLKDQFGTATTTLGTPNVVCLPTVRNVSASGSWTKIVNPTNYSVCFALPATTAATQLAYDKNQFGTGAVKVSDATEACVPSVKAATVTTTTTTVTTGGASTTTTAPPTGGPTTTTTSTSTGSRWMPSSAAPISWNWQLQGTVPTNTGVQVFDIDGFSNSAATVAALHANGTKVICYIDFGTSENFRPDFGSFPASVQGATNGWPGENWLDIRQLSVIEPIMTARMQMCVQKGFDALEPDNIDGYTNSTGFPLTAADQLTYNTWIANEAHSLGLSVGLKNDNDQTSQLEPYFDWALDEQCNQYSECGTEQVFTNANKAVFNAEYQGGTGFCPSDLAAHINGALFDLNLTGSTYQPCPGGW